MAMIGEVLGLAVPRKKSSNLLPPWQKLSLVCFFETALDNKFEQCIWENLTIVRLSLP
jgi:hypothetical protein